MLTLTGQIVRLIGSPSWAVGWSPEWSWMWVAGYYLALFLAVDWLHPNRLTGKFHLKLSPASALIGLLILANLVCWSVLGYRIHPRYLQLAMLDVGQGDALLVKTPDGHSVLVDAGDVGKGNGRVLPALREAGIDRLDQVYISHGHRDHLGGLGELIGRVGIGALYYPAGNETPELREILAKAARARVRCHSVSRDQTMKLGDYVSEAVYPVDAGEMGAENDRSLVLMIDYGKNKILLTGDLGPEGEAMLVQKFPQRLRSTVLKVAHHGSDLGTGMPFLAQIKPAVALISVGASNRYGHPGPGVLNRLRSLGIPVYRTDRQGRIDLRIYQEYLTVAVAGGLTN
jgi:competence protein ComEC